MEDTDVTAIVAVYNESGQVLLLKRAESSACQPGKWSFPGGHAVTNETEVQAAIREVNEETGITISNLEFVRRRKKNYLFKTFTYSGIVTRETLDLYENTDFAWVGFKELENYNIVPGLRKDLMLTKR